MSGRPAAPPWIAGQLCRLLEQRGHAWLLQGASGLGQYGLALDLVRAWLCEQPGPDGACFSTTAATRLEWALPEPVRGRHLLVRADFTVGAGTPARLVVTETGRSWVPANNDGTVWAAGAAGVLDTVAVRRVARVGYDSFAPGREVCLSGLAVGVWSVR